MCGFESSAEEGGGTVDLSFTVVVLNVTLQSRCSSFQNFPAYYAF